jgi:hypothetical protein
MSLEKWHDTILAEKGVFARDRLPDQEAVKGIAVIRRVGKPVKG